MQHNTLSMYNSLIGRKVDQIERIQSELEKAKAIQLRVFLEDAMQVQIRDLDRIFAVRHQEVNGGIYV